jgi:hypothetical protein
MAVIQILKKMKRFTKSALSQIIRLANSFRYLYLTPTNKSDLSMEAHLLVVKKTIYAPIVKVCVESFLYFHPKSCVVIHLDAITINEVSKKLHKVISRGRVEVRLVENNDLSWQELKLNLILGLGSSQKFFMDADLKWNGPIPTIQNITLFVDEFKFKNNEFYLPLLMSDFFQSHLECSMKNTSFFYWGNHSPKATYRDLVHQMMEEILKITLNPDNPAEFNSSTRRISEQIALSLLVESTGEKVEFLKQSDGYKDGSFVESSYFGATGSSF